MAFELGTEILSQNIHCQNILPLPKYKPREVRRRFWRTQSLVLGTSFDSPDHESYTSSMLEMKTVDRLASLPESSTGISIELDIEGDASRNHA
jgi:hypothetical protein